MVRRDHSIGRFWMTPIAIDASKIKILNIVILDILKEFG
jgi:hypothetical protein